MKAVSSAGALRKSSLKMVLPVRSGSANDGSGVPSASIVEGVSAIAAPVIWCAHRAVCRPAPTIREPTRCHHSRRFLRRRRGSSTSSVFRGFKCRRRRAVRGRWLKRFSNRPCTTWGGRGTSARTDAGGPMRAYSMDLRERALLDSDAGMTAADVAAKYRGERVVGAALATAAARHGRGGASRPATWTARHAGAAPAHRGRSDCGAPGSHAGGAEGRPRHARACADGLARRAGPRPDREQKRSARPNTIGLPSRPRGSRGTRRRRPGTSPTSCFWTETGITNTLLRRYGRAPRGARASTTTPPAGAGRPARCSPRCGSRG